MTEILISCYILLLLIDIINLLDLRKLVYSFLLSKRNLKKSREIHLQQTKKDKLTLSYIKDYCIHPKEFIFFQRLWVVHLCSIVPQYLLIVALNLFFSTTALIIMIVLFVLKVILAVLITSQFSAKRISRFDKRY